MGKYRVLFVISALLVAVSGLWPRGAGAVTPMRARGHGRMWGVGPPLGSSGVLFGTGDAGARLLLTAQGRLRSGPVPPPTGSLYGAGLPNVGGVLGTAMAQVEREVGRRLDLERIYDQWDTPQPSAVMKWAAANGYVPFLNISARTTKGGWASWSTIAADGYDATIEAQARGLASLGVPILLSFDREPENDRGNKGTSPATYVAAFRHYVTVFRNVGVTNVSFAFVSGALAFTRGVASSFYPGGAYANWIGADGYNTYGCTSSTGSRWESFSRIFSPFYAFGSAHRKPLVIAEWASTEDPKTPGRKAGWITAAAATIKGWSQVKAESYIDTPGAHNRTCDYQITSSPSAEAAMAQMGADPYFNPKPQASLLATPAAGTAPLKVALGTLGTVSPASPITSWAMNFGDGSAVDSGTGNPPGAFDHTYGVGTFSATMSVTASDGQSDFAMARVDSD